MFRIGKLNITIDPYKQQQLCQLLDEMKEFFNLPLSPVKKATISAICLYLNEVYKNQTLASYISNDLNERMRSIEFITNQLLLSDDQFILSVQNHIENISNSSSFKKKLTLALSASKEQLTLRRENFSLKTNFTLIIAGIALISKHPSGLSMVLGAGLIGLGLSNKTQNVSKELLEICDATLIQRNSPQIQTSYYRAFR